MTLPATTERQLDDAFVGATGIEGFVARHHVIDVYGRCADCA